MTWRSFMDYVIMRELGQDDAITRNYDLLHLNGSKPGMVLDRAAARMGLDQRNIARPFILPTIGAQMRSVGYNPPTDVEAFAALVREWYIWDRIRTKDLQRWPLKSRDNPLL